MENILITAGGKIKCKRCLGVSRRTKMQCKLPALNRSKKQKCKFHGGAATGATSKAGLEKLSKTRLAHGNETKEKRLQRSEQSKRLQQLEDALHLLEMTNAPRSPGRKAKGYTKLTKLADIKKAMG